MGRPGRVHTGEREYMGRAGRPRALGTRQGRATGLMVLGSGDRGVPGEAASVCGLSHSAIHRCGELPTCGGWGQTLCRGPGLCARGRVREARVIQGKRRNGLSGTGRFPLLSLGLRPILSSCLRGDAKCKRRVTTVTERTGVASSPMHRRAGLRPRRVPQHLPPALARLPRAV